MEELEKFVKEVEGLKKGFSKLRDDFDKPGLPTSGTPGIFQTELDAMRKKFEAIEKQTAAPASGVLKGIKYYVEDIEKNLGKIERGLDYTGNLQSSVNSLKEAFKKFEGAKKDLKRLESDIDMMDTDIKDLSQHFTKQSNFNGAVQAAMQKRASQI